MTIAASTVRPAPVRFPYVHLLAPLAVAIVLAALFFRSSPDLGVYWLVGLAVGVVLQRSRFCFAGAFRDLFLSHDGRTMRAVLTGLAIATPGFWLLMSRLVPDPSFGGLPPGAHVIPVGLHLIVGGLLFGIGMVVAGGCVSGTLFRIGEGYVSSMVALVGILAGLSLAAHTWNWWWINHISKMPTIWLPQVVGHVWSLVIVMALIGLAFLVVLWWEFREGPPFSPPSKAAPPAMSLGETLRRFQRAVFHNGWPVLTGGIALAVINVFSFVYEHPVGVTGELSVWAERFTGLFGLGAGNLLGTDQFAGCNLAVGDTTLLTASFTLDFGLIFGSFLAALASNEFKLRFPRQKSRYLQQIGGGVFMGYGAGIAIGCTLGAFFSAVPSLAVSGWVFGLALTGGAFLGTVVIKRLP